MVWAGGTQLQSNKYRYKVLKKKKNSKELKTLEVNLYQTDGVILLLERLCSCRSPEAKFEELAEQGLHNYYRRGFGYLNHTAAFRTFFLVIV